jgi:hypothetical protein
MMTSAYTHACTHARTHTMFQWNKHFIFNTVAVHYNWLQQILCTHFWMSTLNSHHIYPNHISFSFISIDNQEHIVPPFLMFSSSNLDKNIIWHIVNAHNLLRSLWLRKTSLMSQISSVCKEIIYIYIYQMFLLLSHINYYNKFIKSKCKFLTFSNEFQCFIW